MNGRTLVGLQTRGAADKIALLICRAFRVLIRTHMNVDWGKRRCYGAAGALFVLHAILAIAPERAAASCGHGVSSSGPRLSFVSDLIMPASSTESDAHRAPIAPTQDRPCTGPSCSRGKGLPDAPSPPFRVSSELVCWTGAECAWSSSGLERAVVDFPPALSRHSTSPPERPPRGA
jgi:hypothetical protein